MKRMLVLFLIFFTLSACERPATRTNWSPIDGTFTVASSPETGDIAASQSVISTDSPQPTPFPTLDWTTFPETLPKSMKGYELVSWQVGSDWNFTFVTGTNRVKTFDELLSPESLVTYDGFVKITVTGLDELKQALSHLPQGEQIFWSGMDLTGQVPGGTVYFGFPPQAMIDDLTEYCNSLNLTLLSLKEP